MSNMRSLRIFWRTLGRLAAILSVAISAILLLAAAVLVFRERPRAQPVQLSPRDAFDHGTIGTELIPYSVLKVLPSLTRESGHFAPLGKDKGDWIEQFGFLRRANEASSSLPVGFTLSYYRPRSGLPSPVQFVGIGCATCHTTDIIRPDGGAFRVTGTGNASVNLFAWLDALQAAILDQKYGDYVVSAQSTSDELERQNIGKPSLGERLAIRLWLDGFRKTLRGNLPRFDEPYGHGQSMAGRVTPTGPGRTQPFRTLVRSVLGRPGNDMFVFTKVAPVFHERWQEWAQVDGGIRGLEYRSALAVLAAGATLETMKVPEVEHNIRAATKFVTDLAGPKFTDVFPNQPAAGNADEGRDVYMRACANCHGSPGPNGKWKDGARQGEVVMLPEIGTDAERVTFRHGEELPEELYLFFPDRHPFKFPKKDIRAPRGYLNKPIDSAFARAPYLHNASVLTLAELINLVPRRAVFYRGRNGYDPTKLGLESPESADDRHYFRFDTKERGNSNAGHNYPWKYNDVQNRWNKAELENLLEYLKTI